MAFQFDRSRFVVASVAAFLALPVLCQAAAPIVYEPFDYPTGSVAGKDGGTGFGGAWTGGATDNRVTSPGSAYPGLPTAGNKLSLAGNGNGDFRAVSNHPSTGTLYVSFIGQVNNNVTDGYAGLSLFSGTNNEQLFLGAPYQSAFWGIDPHGGNGANSTTPNNVPTFLVYRVDFNGSNETVRLYTNPTLGAEPATADATTTKTSAFTWDTIRIQSGNGATQTGSFDEIRMGTSYASVTPEPGSLALLGLSAGTLLFRRRRA